MKHWVVVMVAGGLIGGAYTLSSLTTMFLLALVPLLLWVSRDVSGMERRWLLALLGLAVALRLAVIAGLFLTADPDIPYANFFGDEEFFKRRTVWMRNLGVGIPISTADYFYAFDQTGNTSYLYFLSYIQALVDVAPYGVHVLNAALYLVAAVTLYKLVRPSFGGLAALIGIVLLLFLPSLFIWSISALKEPLYFFVVSINLVATVAMMRTGNWVRRIGAGLIVIAGGLVLQSIREGGLAICAAGVVGGATLAFIAKRPKLIVPTLVIAPIVIALSMTLPAVQARVWSVVHEAAYKHWGHVHTPGLTYKLLDDRLYPDRGLVATMTPGEAGRFVVRAMFGFVTVPLPWEIESRAALAFLPEQMVWYALLVLVAIGAVAGLRHDPILTSVLLAHGAAVTMLVALSGGNIGTLVRHRGLTLSYFAWLAGFGAVTLGRWLLERRSAKASAFSQIPPDTKVLHAPS